MMCYRTIVRSPEVCRLSTSTVYPSGIIMHQTLLSHDDSDVSLVMYSLYILYIDS